MSASTSRMSASASRASAPTSAPPPTIGVFDSGFGGLTVLRELLPRLPGAHFLYLGDTARLPYGAKSQATVARYATEAARFLSSAGADLLVIACNTATALALPELRAAVPIPVVGVIEPGAHAALQATRLSSPAPAAEAAALQTQTLPADVLVLATAATVQSHAYALALSALGLRATERACPLLVPLVEEGWIDHPVTRDVLRIYLTEALSVTTPAAVLLGCTHYPLLAVQIRAALHDLGSPAPVIDSAAATAQAVVTALPQPAVLPATPATFACYATDSVGKFARLGSLFLGRPIPAVTLLDLGG